MSLEAFDIFRRLPHRYPMLMVDRIVAVEPGRRAVGIKCVSVNEPHFPGHYPDEPIMPGVLILEAMAQVGGIALGAKTIAARFLSLPAWKRRGFVGPSLPATASRSSRSSSGPGRRWASSKVSPEWTATS